MKTLLTAAFAFGLAATVSTTAFADCAGHVSAENKGKPVTTADTRTTTLPPVTDKQG